MKSSIAEDIANWAFGYIPDQPETELADRALADTLACILAARDDDIGRVASVLSEAGRWATLGHVLDYDDLHLSSNSHISVVCVPATVACGGRSRDYLVGAGAMARLGTALGWSHYLEGWHTTSTAGCVGAAVSAGSAIGLSAAELTTAITLAVASASGVQRSFGTHNKALQVGFAVEAGIRAARLAQRGATANPGTVEAWMRLVAAAPGEWVSGAASALPDGLAIKIYPCCYALQRPINAIGELRSREPGIDASSVLSIGVRTPFSATVPLIHHRPTTGLQSKFSLEYALAAALLDEPVGLASFTDEAATRSAAHELISKVDVSLLPGGQGLLDGSVAITIRTLDQREYLTVQEFPPGAPQRPPTPSELAGKIQDCVRAVDTDPDAWTWLTAAEMIRAGLRQSEISDVPVRGERSSA